MVVVRTDVDHRYTLKETCNFFNSEGRRPGRLTTQHSLSYEEKDGYFSDHAYLISGTDLDRTIPRRLSAVERVLVDLVSPF